MKDAVRHLAVLGVLVMQPSVPAFVPGQTYRLVTRSDFDGLVCAVLFKRLGIIDDILFVHPKDVQDGVVELTERDITTNLPYDPRPYAVFDHHASETLRNTERAVNHVIDPTRRPQRGSSTTTSAAGRPSRASRTR